VPGAGAGHLRGGFEAVASSLLREAAKGATTGTDPVRIESPGFVMLSDSLPNPSPDTCVEDSKTLPDILGILGPK
jgi:hypothetical protein